MSFRLLQKIKTSFPTAQELAVKLLQPSVFLNNNPSLQSLQSTKFQFPASSHPLVEIAKAIQGVQQKQLEAIAAASVIKGSFTALEEPAKALFAEKKIQDVLTNTEKLLQLYSQPNRELFDQLGPDLKNTLCGLIYECSQDGNKINWGMEGVAPHALDDIGCLQQSITDLIHRDLLTPSEEKVRVFALEHLQQASQEEKNAIYESVYHIAGRPKTSDLQWGEHNITQDTARLLSALHCHAKVGGPLQNAYYLANWESGAPQRSQYYSIEGQELAKGEIGFINGMLCSFEAAYAHAQKIQAAYCPGYALHCVYGATQGPHWDACASALGHSLNILPQGRLLIQRWIEFCERCPNPQEKYLQICTSRGAIDVAAALNALPPSLRQRIIVIAIAPGYIIDKTLCYKVMDFVIPQDSVPYLAPNHELIGKDFVVQVLPNHADGSDPHNPHGSSYREAVYPLIAQYLQTNDIIA